MAYTITITEEYDEPNRDNDGVTTTTRQLYSQTVDQLDLPAVLKAVNGIGRKTRTRSGRKAAS